MGWLAYSFRGSVSYHHGGEHGGLQTVMVLENQLQTLHLAGNRKSTEMLGNILSIGNLKACPHSDTFSNKATAIPTKPHLLIVSLL